MYSCENSIKKIIDKNQNMNFLQNINQILSQKLFLFQSFLENLRIKLINLNQAPLQQETCIHLKNIRVMNFKMYTFAEIYSVYGNFLKEK